jgi:hypothetical protein
MNRHPYGRRDIDVAAEKIVTHCPDPGNNPKIVATAVLDAVMVDRHRRDAERRKVWWRQTLRLAAQGAGHVALMLLLIACGVFGTLLYLGVFPAR